MRGSQKTLKTDWVYVWTLCCSHPFCIISLPQVCQVQKWMPDDEHIHAAVELGDLDWGSQKTLKTDWVYVWTLCCSHPFCIISLPQVCQVQKWMPNDEHIHAAVELGDLDWGSQKTLKTVWVCVWTLCYSHPTFIISLLQVRFKNGCRINCAVISMYEGKTHTKAPKRIKVYLLAGMRICMRVYPLAGMRESSFFGSICMKVYPLAGMRERLFFGSICMRVYPLAGMRECSFFGSICMGVNPLAAHA